MTNLMNLFQTWMTHNLTIKAKKMKKIRNIAIILIDRKGQKQRHRKI